MADKAPEPVKSTQQLDLEARQAEDYVSPLAKFSTVGPNENLVDENGFVGVSPEYANNANETDAPLAAESGPEKVIEDAILGAVEEEPAQQEPQAKHAASTQAPAENQSS